MNSVSRSLDKGGAGACVLLSPLLLSVPYLPSELEGEQGPGTWEDHTWSIALKAGNGGPCTHTNTGSAANPAYWFVKFKGGERRHVSKIRLWNDQGTCCQDRLNSACVRFTTDGQMPSNQDPGSNCDMNLPAVVDSAIGEGTGTEVLIDRAITGMMLITTHTDYIMTVCGIELYKTSDRPVTLFDNALLTANQSSGEGKDLPLGPPPFGSHTGEVDNEHGWWSAEFTDGQPRFVSAVKLRNRPDCCQTRLSFADVLFDDETEPAFTLPNVAVSGTVVDVGRSMTRIKFRNSKVSEVNYGLTLYYMTVVGFQLFLPDVEPYLPSEFDGQQGPGTWDNNSWDIALKAGDGGACSHTDFDTGLTTGSADDPGYWFVKIKGGERRHVWKILLWNRGTCCQERLNNACVRFTTDGQLPSNEDPGSNCDMNLPAVVDSATGEGTGTEVLIDREITGMMLITTSTDYIMAICGIEIYKGPSTTTTTTTTSSPTIIIKIDEDDVNEDDADDVDVDEDDEDDTTTNADVGNKLDSAVVDSRADAEGDSNTGGEDTTLLYMGIGVAVLAVCAAIAFALQPAASEDTAASPSDSSSSNEGSGSSEEDDAGKDAGGGKNRSVALGQSKVLGGGSIALGQGSMAAGGGTAIGGGSMAAGQGSMAARAGGSMAIGGGSMAAGRGSMAAGAGGSTAIGGGSMAAGQGSMAARAGGSMAIGGGSMAAGQGSMAAGAGGSMAIGGGSMAAGQGSMAAGAGGSMAIGGGSMAAGRGSMAAGGGGSMAIGGGSMAAGRGSMAGGAGGSMAVGGGSMAAGQGSMAAGAGGSMAIGGGSMAAGRGSMAAGGGGSPRSK